MAAQQQHSHALHQQISWCRRPASPQHRIEQQRVIVVAGQQSHRAAHVLAQGSPQPGIATPAFVLAKVPRHQHQIGVQGPTKLESSLEVSQGRPAAHQPLISRHQVWITELKNPHRSPEWTASRCSSGLDP